MKKPTLKTAVALFAAAGLLTQPISIATAADDIELTVVSWGGAYSASQQNAYHDPYMANNSHVKIVNDDSSAEAVARLRAMKEAGNVTWDLVDVTAGDAIRLCDEGLVREIDHAKELPAGNDGSNAVADFGDFIVSDCLIPQIIYSTTFGYRTDVPEWNGQVPTTIADVFDTKKFPGKRSLQKTALNNLPWALIADGVPASKVFDVLSTEEGVNRAFAKLDTIKDDIIWWSAGADTPQRLADGQVVIGSTYNGRLFSVIEEEKQPVAMLWDHQILDIDGWVIPADLPADRLEVVMDLVSFATDTQRLADQAKYISYGPARKSSAPLVGKHAELGIDMAPHMPTDPANSGTAFVDNFEWWADNRDELDQRFQAWLSQ